MNGGTKGKTYAAKSAKGRIVNYRPALSCALALVAGILFAFSVTYRRVPSMIAVIIGFTALAATCVFLSPKNGKFVPARLIALLLFFSLGAGEFLVYRKNYRSEFYSGEKEVFAKITERRDYSVGTFFVFDDLSFDGKSASGKLVMFVYTNYDSSFSEIADRLKEGDLIGFGAQISTNTSWLETKDDGSIANRAYYWREDIRYEAEKCRNLRFAGSDANAFEKIRAKLKTTLFSSMNEDAAAVSYALLTGETSEMNEELLENIRYGGIAHIFAVSGLHIGALFAFLAALFKTKKFSFVPPFVRWLVVAALLVFYGGVCGYSASVIRAAVMCLVFYADTLLGFKRDGTDSLGKAAIVVLVLSPISVFDAGFLLSFSAVAGIFFLAPPLERCMNAVFFREKKASESGNAVAEKIPTESEAKTENNADTADGMKTITAIKTESPAKNFLKKCVAFFCVTLSATLFTFPILSVCFSYASGAALLLNVLVVPLVSACFAVFLALAFLACIVAPLAKIILYVPSVLISLLTTFFYAFDFSSSAVALRFTPIAILAYYAALFLSGDKIRLKPPVRIALVSCCALAFVLSFAL